jgi:tungstate transport system substrate-binding protein
VITLDPSKHPHLQEEEARHFAEYLVSDEGQKAIAEFGIERYGQPLFVPDAAP